MKLLIAIPTLNGAERVHRLLEDIQASVLPRVIDRVDVLVIDNGRCLGSRTTPSGLEIVVPRYNLGVAASWNLAMRRARNTEAGLLIANDDIRLGPHAIEQLVHAIMYSAEAFIIAGPAKHVFSCFILDATRALVNVGEFDEQFYPAYWEDNDYEHRLKLAGLDILHVPDLDGFVHHGSATKRQMSNNALAAFDRQYARSRELYIAKWGGTPPRGELFTRPYDTARLRGYDR